MIRSNDSLSGAELRRYRLTMVRRLAEFPLDLDDSPLPFTTIDGLPNWLLQDREGLRRSRRLLGGVCLLPVLRRCIDGGTLRVLSEFFNEDDFTWLLKLQDADLPVLEVVEEAPSDGAGFEAAIEQAGTTLLLDLIGDTHVRRVVKNSLLSPAPELFACKISREDSASIVHVVEDRLSVTADESIMPLVAQTDNQANPAGDVQGQAA